MAYANSADPDQTAPLGAVWSGPTLIAIPVSSLRNNCIKSKIQAKKVWNKEFKILGHLPYPRMQSFLVDNEDWSDYADVLAELSLPSLIAE